MSDVKRYKVQGAWTDEPFVTFGAMEMVAASDYEAALADAERYRWLRDNQTRDALKRLNQESGFKAMDIAAEKYGDEWDAAIDAARGDHSAGAAPK
jgi:hypothetical protein